MRGFEARANAIRTALKDYARVGEMTVVELCRIYSKLSRKVQAQSPMGLQEIVAKAQYRSRSRRTAR